MEKTEALFIALAATVLFCVFAAAIGYLSDASGLTKGRNSPIFAPSPTSTPTQQKKSGRK